VLGMMLITPGAPVLPAVSYQPTGALRSARDYSIFMSDIGGGFLSRSRHLAPKSLMLKSTL
jgi:hypothetical protein